MSLTVSAKVRRKSPQNERLWQTLDIGKCVWANFWLQKFTQFQYMEYNYQHEFSYLDFYLPTLAKFAQPHTFPYLAQNLSSDELWAPLL